MIWRSKRVDPLSKVRASSTERGRGVSVLWLIMMGLRGLQVFMVLHSVSMNRVLRAGLCCVEVSHEAMYMDACTIRRNEPGRTGGQQ